MSQPATAERVPISLVRHQRSMLAAIGRIALRTVIPLGRPRTNPSHFEEAFKIIPPLNNDLVNSYATWSGAPGGYPLTLPPHMVAQWAIPLATEALRQTRYNLASIINQGVALRINGELPRDVALHLTTKVSDPVESGGRARVSVTLTTGTALDPELVEAVLHVTFPLRGMAGARRKPRPNDEEEWSTIGAWGASRNDGFKFALLTGDFNPIHWIPIAGRVSPFRTTVLQGFGTIARTYEILNKAVPVEFLDVKFLGPVALPSPAVEVQVVRSPDHPRVRLIGRDATMHLIGTFKPLP